MTELRNGHGVVLFGPGTPTVLVGERINPPAKAHLRAALRRGDLAVLAAEAPRQVEAGAGVIDVNVGGAVDEPATLATVAVLVAGAVAVPLCLDSADPAALVAALVACGGKPLVSSVLCEESSMRALLPSVAEHGAAVVALPCDRSGVPADPQRRLANAARILERAAILGVPAEDVVVDCCCTPLASDSGSITKALETLRLVREELGVATVAGVSNVSYGIPDRAERQALNRAFLALAVDAGLSAAIADPLAPGIAEQLGGAPQDGARCGAGKGGSGAT